MSNSDFAIKAENIAKIYRLGLKDDSNDTLGSTIASIIRNPVSNFRKYRSLYNFDDLDLENYDEEKTHPDVLWALKGVSFNIAPGEVVGIIGTNGAGKSTLLKILSRITAPTKGKITIKGRVSSLLEVGTGFHQELTGRENVYLNGTILGMTKKEIDGKFDEIVDFSGVERFLDTPVKRYSSGMRVRLAFAVAAYLEPEILIIDEVLAVGDATFQRKCLDKMEDVGKQGRTVLFVSHSMPAVTRMCERVILLNAGRKILDGPPHDVVRQYLQGDGEVSSDGRNWEIDDAPGGNYVRLTGAKVLGIDGKTSHSHDIRNPIKVEIEYQVLESGFNLMPTISLSNHEGVLLCVLLDQDEAWRKQKRAAGKYISRVTVPGNFLCEGQIYINVIMWTLEPSRHMEFNEREVLTFQVIDSFEGGSARGEWRDDLPSAIRPIFNWETEAKD